MADLAWMLDTNTLSELIRNPTGPVVTRLALVAPDVLIGSHDLFIAAHARSRDLTLAAHNLREFRRVPGLRVEDWVLPP